MKALIAALALTFSTTAISSSCGYPPYPPYGMKMVCVCDQYGQNCQWIAVSK